MNFRMMEKGGKFSPQMKTERRQWLVGQKVEEWHYCISCVRGPYTAMYPEPEWFSNETDAWKAVEQVFGTSPERVASAREI